jgi:hypothetical protein
LENAGMFDKTLNEKSQNIKIIIKIVIILFTQNNERKKGINNAR